MRLSDDITGIKGIGEKTAKLFYRLGIHTGEDLLYYYPRDYQLFLPPVRAAEAPLNETVTLELTLLSSFQWKRFKGLTVGTGIASDNTAKVLITYFNTPYLKNVFKCGETYLLRGKLKKEKDRYRMEQPRLYSKEDYLKKMGSLQPCYSLTGGLTNTMVTKAVKQVVELVCEDEYLPDEIVKEYGLIDRGEALKKIHFPENGKQLEAARKRLVFDEFFLFFMALKKNGKMNEEQISAYPMIETADTDRLIEQLPYRLTNAQKRVFEEIKADLLSGSCMNRLVQGDVGSGKTILAFLALLLCVSNGYQGALMAPTELLAAQHFEQLAGMVRKYGLPLKPVLLTGSIGQSLKKKLYGQIEGGEVNVVIGTHALIQEKVVYKNLALVITDEQHRFGVRQREALSNKGYHTHVLVMSATPIPRTLAIILYGDLHLSAVDELPADRLPVKNCVVNTGYRKKAYEFIQKETEKGRQVYVICPMVDENENAGDIENVTDYAVRLKNELPDTIRVDYLHGKMKPAEKNRIMEEFAAGNIDVLVSTTVIEVGINVPNATVMMIENAERFGLAQLHQLRGRIGRGKEQSYCIFVSGTDKESSMERLKILNKSNDGFTIAEEDLKLRGPGDLLGIRQSGVMEFKLADIYRDSELLKKVSLLVEQILYEDESLLLEGNARIRQYLDRNAVKFIDFRSI